MLWRKHNFWALEACLDDEVDDTRLSAVKGGIAMCIHLRLQLLIYDQASLVGNRVQWIRFKGMEGEHIGILDAYASRRWV